MRLLNVFFGLLPLRILRIFFLNFKKENKISYKAKLGIGIYYLQSIKVEKFAKIENGVFFKIDNLHYEDLYVCMID